MKKIILPQDDNKLLEECRVSTFRARGAGGQHVNVTDSAVRLIHRPTGIVVTSQKERSQYLNKRACIEKLRQVVEKRNYRKPKRVPTQPSKSVLRKRREARSRASEKRRLRRPVQENE